MLDLKRRAPDVRRFVVTIEEWIIRTLADFNVRGERRDDRIGVWVRRPDKGQGVGEVFEDKIAAIGIRVRQWVTLHGFALNVEPDLSHFSGIVPCGVADRRYGVTSLADLGLTVSMPEVDMALRAAFEPLFGATAMLKRCRAPRTIRRAGAASVRRGRPRADRRNRRGQPGGPLRQASIMAVDGFFRPDEQSLDSAVAAIAHPALDSRVRAR